jgi:hypothetical protein
MMKRDPHDACRRPPVKPWVRNRRILLTSFFGITAGIVLFLGVTHHLNTRRYAALLESIRAQGAPATVAELQQWQNKEDAEILGETPSSENGATPVAENGETAVDIYLKSTDLLEALRTSAAHDEINDMLKQLDDGQALSPEDLNKLRAYLEEHQELLQMLHEAAALPPGKFPLDYSKGFAMELPHLARIRDAARLLRAEAVYAAMTGDTDLSYEALMSCLAVQSPLRGEALIISQIVSIACQTIASEGLQNTLAYAGYNDEQLAVLQQRLSAEHNTTSLTNALMVERVFALEAYNDPATFIAPGRTWMDEIIPGSYAALLRTANAFGWFSGDRQEYLECMEEMIAASRLPYAEARPTYAALETRGNDRSILPYLNSSLFASLTRVPAVMARGDAQLSLGSTAAAIERYRLAAGAAPDQLDALVPAYLSGVPEDPFDQQPLRYRREGEGYTLYSIGANGADDGGTPAVSTFERDLVFNVRR